MTILLLLYWFILFFIVYNAVGLAAFDLYDEIDFDSWFSNILIPELQIKINGYVISYANIVYRLPFFTIIVILKKKNAKFI